MTRVHQAWTFNVQVKLRIRIYRRGNNYSFCDKDIVLDQFNKTEDYEVFANDSLKPIMQKKEMENFYWNDMDIINLGKILKEKGGEKPYR